MPRELVFDQGVLKLSSFDPLSNRVETRILKLPDVPALESLEQLFINTTSTPYTTQPNNTRTTEVPLLRSTRSLNTKKPLSPNRAPRRCYSNPALSKKKDVMGSSAETWKMPRRSPSKRNLLNALSGLIQKAKRPASIRRRVSSRRSSANSSIQGTWHTQTWLIEMRASTDSLVEPTTKGSRCCPSENWWATSPPLNTTTHVL
ncbi:hypothetical protein O0I10_005859 [Lichtheimia ornata]|uniref:Uncharacterized protein n=1 Tax=Lichtheimia ornata TaxID=688661 RepID=A0AAD7XZD4_9FUNG|nr:uncharacterized protein O0I10_005859 [Lichtheimia ornata]KAJ8658506.1 hypothetical protein O0I10_005859 [Lichtheimia ornata]